MHTKRSHFMPLIAGIALLSPAVVLGSSILSDPAISAMSPSSLFNISTIGSGDWILPGLNDKAGANSSGSLSINGSHSGAAAPGLDDSVGYLSGAPFFSYNDGTAPSSSAGTLSHFELMSSGSFYVTCGVTPFLQTLTLFFGATTGNLTSTLVRASLFGGSPGDNLTTGAPVPSFTDHLMTFEYSFSSTTATSLEIQVSKFADYGVQSGIFAAAVTAPEPSATALAIFGSLLIMGARRRYPSAG